MLLCTVVRVGPLLMRLRNLCADAVTCVRSRRVRCALHMHRGYGGQDGVAPKAPFNFESQMLQCPIGGPISTQQHCIRSVFWVHDMRGRFPVKQRIRAPWYIRVQNTGSSCGRCKLHNTKACHRRAITQASHNVTPATGEPALAWGTCWYRHISIQVVLPDVSDAFIKLLLMTDTHSAASIHSCACTVCTASWPQGSPAYTSMLSGQGAHNTVSPHQRAVLTISEKRCTMTPYSMIAVCMSM